jgi:hypothetical protein
VNATVGHYQVLGVGQGGKGAQVGLVAGGEEQGGREADECGQLELEHTVLGKVAGD